MIDDGDSDGGDVTRIGAYRVVRAIKQAAEEVGVDQKDARKIEENLRQRFNIPKIESAISSE